MLQTKLLQQYGDKKDEQNQWQCNGKYAGISSVTDPRKQTRQQRKSHKWTQIKSMYWLQHNA